MNSIGLSTTWVVPSSVFYLISYVRLESGADLVESPMKARETLEVVGGSQWLYAGKVVLMGLRSGQLGEHQWAAIVLSLYDSREAYDEVARSNTHSQAYGSANGSNLYFITTRLHNRKS
ncbi:MAG: hypothetical protein HOK91_11110 [Gammaproteobacteria bacterium]|jgi:hypothetical protein|nr:hypothetical protein [Gammaproteobacteria bacterium]